MSNQIIDRIISNVCLDERISDGIFKIEDNDHMGILREYLVRKGINEDIVKEFSNLVLEKGKYPERQAYNQKGILVTFPTPEYKQKAIEKGTHFEKDPTKGASNLFNGHETSTGEPGSNQEPSTPPSDTTSKEPESKTNLPASQASTPVSDPDPDSPTPSNDNNPPQVQTTAAPQQTPVSTKSTEPIKEPTTLPAPVAKSPEEKEADKQAIKTMLKGDDYMLEVIIDYLRFNAPEYLIKEIRSKIL